MQKPFHSITKKFLRSTTLQSQNHHHLILISSKRLKMNYSSKYFYFVERKKNQIGKFLGDATS